MKYKILKDFRGSQDGIKTSSFKKGEVVELTPYLASCVAPDCVELIAEKQEQKTKVDAIENKAISTSGKSKKVKNK